MDNSPQLFEEEAEFVEKRLTRPTFGNDFLYRSRVNIDANEGYTKRKLNYDLFACDDVPIEQEMEVSQQSTSDQSPVRVRFGESSSNSGTSSTGTVTRALLSPLSNQGKYSPLSFATNHLFDCTNGVPYSRSHCQEQFKKLFKHQKDSDYYDYLLLAQDFFQKDDSLFKIALGLAYNTEMTNQLRKAKVRSGVTEIRDDSTILEKKGFDVLAAKFGEKPVALPSGKTFLLSDMVSPYDASNWSSSRFDTDVKSLIRFILRKVAPFDPFFICYASPNSSTQHYVPIGEPFYKAFYLYTSQGFGQPPCPILETKIYRMVRETLTNLIDRIRSEHNKDTKYKLSSKEIAENLTAQLQAIGTRLEYSPIDFTDTPQSAADVFRRFTQEKQ
uniref:Uncharacterized protein n=1 Tax=Caenorhabditis japonica TaxID=281687 RepID=A0A8R1IZE4_CAEJA